MVEMDRVVTIILGLETVVILWNMNQVPTDICWAHMEQTNTAQEINYTLGIIKLVNEQTYTRFKGINTMHIMKMELGETPIS